MSKKKLYSQTKKFEKINARFQALTAEEKRVAIAKDVIFGLEAKKLKASPGTYVEVDVEFTEEDQVCDLTSKASQCNVCALGAIFVATVEKADEYQVSDGYYFGDFEKEDGPMDKLEMAGSDIRPYLEQYFEEGQLGLIEAAFEECSSFAYSHGNHSVEAATAAAEFAFGLTPHMRMKKIMQNIIKNSGTFVP